MLVEASIICERLVAETMPVATDCSRPNGLPMDMTHSPMVMLSESPSVMGVKPLPSLTFSTATSELASVPTKSAS